MPKTREEMTAKDKKNISINARAIDVLYCALNEHNFTKVQACTSTKEIWEPLNISNKGTFQVNETKISILTYTYKLFRNDKIWNN